jgi:hypothetical protein
MLSRLAGVMLQNVTTSAAFTRRRIVSIAENAGWFPRNDLNCRGLPRGGSGCRDCRALGGRARAGWSLDAVNPGLAVSGVGGLLGFAFGFAGFDHGAGLFG